MAIYNLIEYSDNCSGTTRNLWQDYKDEPKNPVTDSNSFKFKAGLLANTNNCDIINAEIAVLLKFLSNFGRTLEMSLINCEINIILTWSSTCVIAKKQRNIFCNNRCKTLHSSCNIINQ